jgi:hypothetical protein
VFAVANQQIVSRPGIKIHIGIFEADIRPIREAELRKQAEDLFERGLKRIEVAREMGISTFQLSKLV